MKFFNIVRRVFGPAFNPATKRTRALATSSIWIL
jgi:hypothetical protein